MLTQLYPFLNGNAASIWVEPAGDGKLLVRIVPQQVVEASEPLFKTVTIIAHPQDIDSTEYKLQWPRTTVRAPYIPEREEIKQAKKKPEPEPEPAMESPPTPEPGPTPAIAVETPSESPASPSPEPSSSAPVAPVEAPVTAKSINSDRIKSLRDQIATLNASQEAKNKGVA